MICSDPTIASLSVKLTSPGCGKPALSARDSNELVQLLLANTLRPEREDCFYPVTPWRLSSSALIRPPQVLRPNSPGSLIGAYQVRYGDRPAQGNIAVFALSSDAPHPAAGTADNTHPESCPAAASSYRKKHRSHRHHRAAYPWSLAARAKGPSSARSSRPALPGV